MRQHTAQAALINFFHSAGERLAEETEMLGMAVRTLIARGVPVTNKAIILQLIADIENAQSAARVNVLRQTLDIVVGRTPDDI
ncbi:transcriptional regulator [Yokenella regensburgei]|uniref:biofilm development regulator YmgB/AriR family protein n=1 Tax=Yokenella regensburgei TaxID=158877 RepID=UPI003F135358